MYFGPHNLETVKTLLEAGAPLIYQTHGGGSVLTNLMSSEDSDPEVPRYVLKKLKSSHPEEYSSIINSRDQRQH